MIEVRSYTWNGSDWEWNGDGWQAESLNAWMAKSNTPGTFDAYEDGEDICLRAWDPEDDDEPVDEFYGTVENGKAI